jgi:YidC/Oxa1 family membrane protein insertase
MDILNYLGSIFGYILYFFYMILQNYGVAIIVFTILIRAAMFPLNIKQQRSMAATSRVAEKQKELQKKYANDKERYQEELQKLYDKEGASPSGGCLVSLIPFPIMLGLYYAIIYPLSNALHLASASITSATTVLSQIPGVSASFSSRFVQLEIVRNFDTIKPYLTGVWTNDEIARVEKFSHSCNFLGLDLLQTPWGGPAVLWIIPILCLLIAVGTQVYSMLTNDAMKQQQGCMKVTMLALPLITAYLALTMPGAIGFYWVISNMATFAQTVVLNKCFSREHMTANKEARRLARRVAEEARVPEIPLAERRAITAENIRNQGTANNQKKKKKK